MKPTSVTYGTLDWLAAMNGVEVVSNAPGETSGSRTFVSATEVSIIHGPGPNIVGDYSQRALKGVREFTSRYEDSDPV